MAEDIDKDIEYLRNKLSFTFDEPSRSRLLKQIALLEDALTVYNNNKTRDQAYDEPKAPDGY